MHLLLGLLMQSPLLIAVQLANFQTGYLLIPTTRSMSQIGQIAEFKFGLTIVLIQHKQFPAVCQLQLVFSLQVMVIFMLIMDSRMVELINGH